MPGLPGAAGALRADEPAPASQKPATEQKPAAEQKADKAPEPGHSMHGETFDEGPRQAAYLMQGMGNIQFAITTKNEDTKKFFNQGVAQLHGFWYYEAERSFRQASMLDPECAMCYWGMAMANVNNRKRAEGFITQAVERKSQGSEREQMYIDAAHKRFREKSDGKKLSKKEIAQAYTRDLEELVLKYPEDIEARAFLGLQLWENERSDLPLASHVAVNSVLQDVFDKNPMHPAHHYRIHLWDRRQPAQALASAAQCGPSLPGIAHMWHMPGHTYSNLNRFQDAVWQQEASARVDHAHMMRDHILPDQIHNFAHNNEWMIRNLLKIGRVNDAVSLATNMIQLPRHPKYNSLKGGSAKYGRERLLLTLSSYRLWPEVIAAIQSGLIERGEEPATQVECLRYLGVAHAMLDQAAPAADILAQLNSRLAKVEAEWKALTDEEKPVLKAASPDEGVPPAPQPRTPDKSMPVAAAASAAKATCEDEAKKKAEAQKIADEDKKKAEANRKRLATERAEKKKQLEPIRKQLMESVAAVQAAQASRAGQWDRAIELSDKAGSWDKLLKVEWLAKAGKLDKALEMAAAEIKSNPGTVLPGAVQTYVRWQSRGASDAKAEFEKLREAAGTSDLATPLLARLKPLALELGFGEAWTLPYQAKTDIGPRPNLDSLGPFRYSPYNAPTWEAKTRAGEIVSSNKFAGKPVVVIFYLGFGCLHCLEQLQEFSPVADKFKSAGIELVAISTESTEELAKGIDNYAKPLAIPLLADPALNTFKSFRCFDDFEKKPLHGTFLIDAQGKVLWQDISYEPFKDEEFLLKESARLVKTVSRQ
ncbi:MAG: redoxin domain-containing protein [Pirellulaceae bacterium]|nr:redoxin domain-containing protein [Pirellulaceae bacterium]